MLGTTPPSDRAVARQGDSGAGAQTTGGFALMMAGPFRRNLTHVSTEAAAASEYLRGATPRRVGRSVSGRLSTNQSPSREGRRRGVLQRRDAGKVFACSE